MENKRVEIKMNDIYDMVIENIDANKYITKLLLENGFDLTKPVGRIRDKVSVLLFQ